MKNIKLLAIFTMFFLFAFVSTAWAVDVSVTYKIDVQGSIIRPVAYIYNVEANSKVAQWEHGAKTLWPANEGHVMNDDNQITLTPNKDLDKTDKNENDESTSTTAFSTEKYPTTFTVATARQGYFIKSVTFKEDDTEKASSSNIAPNSTLISVVVPEKKFFNYITVVLTNDRYYRLNYGETLTVDPSPSMTYNNMPYYVAGTIITIAPTDENRIVESVSGVDDYTIADDKRSATFTMPYKNVTISAKLFKIWGDGDGSKEKPYTISRSLDLDTLFQRVNAGNDFQNTYFEVINDFLRHHKN